MTGILGRQVARATGQEQSSLRTRLPARFESGAAGQLREPERGLGIVEEDVVTVAGASGSVGVDNSLATGRAADVTPPGDPSPAGADTPVPADRSTGGPVSPQQQRTRHVSNGAPFGKSPTGPRDSLEAPAPTPLFEATRTAPESNPTAIVSAPWGERSADADPTMTHSGVDTGLGPAFGRGATSEVDGGTPEPLLPEAAPSAPSADVADPVAGLEGGVTSIAGGRASTPVQLPDVVIRIGRIDVRAATPAKTTSRPERQATPTANGPSLTDYLKTSGGRR